MTNRKKSISRNPRPRKWEREHPARAVRFASQEELRALQGALSASGLSLREALLDWQKRWDAEQERTQAQIEMEVLQKAIKEGEQRLAEVEAELKAAEIRYQEVNARLKRAHDSVRTIKARVVKEGLAEGRRQAAAEAQQLTQTAEQRLQVSQLLTEFQNYRFEGLAASLTRQKAALERAATILAHLFLCPEIEEVAREIWYKEEYTGAITKRAQIYRSITSIAAQLRLQLRRDPQMSFLDFWGGKEEAD